MNRFLYACTLVFACASAALAQPVARVSHPPDRVAPGQMFEIDGSTSVNADTYDWIVGNSDAGFLRSDGGARIGLKLDSPGSYTYWLIVSGRDKDGKAAVSKLRGRVVVDATAPTPGPMPDPGPGPVVPPPDVAPVVPGPPAPPPAPPKPNPAPTVPMATQLNVVCIWDAGDPAAVPVARIANDKTMHDAAIALNYTWTNYDISAIKDTAWEKPARDVGPPSMLILLNGKVVDKFKFPDSKATIMDKLRSFRGVPVSRNDRRVFTVGPGERLSLVIY
jgi:hypothetical protein